MARKAEQVDKELYNILHSKMIASGWKTVRSFTAGSRVPCSIETVRRAMNECEYKGIAPNTIAVIAHHLGFTPNEIQNILKTYTGDDVLWKLIGDHASALTPDEESVVEIFRQIKAAGNDVLAQFISHLELIGNAFKIDLESYLVNIRR
jgi:hypothetical protein